MDNINITSEIGGPAYTVSLPVISNLSDKFNTDSFSNTLDAETPQPKYIGDKKKIFSNDDPIYRRPREGYTTDIYVLKLSEKEDLKKYKELLDLAGTSLFTRIRYIERQWDADSHNWIILIELITTVLVDPDKR